MGIPSGRVSLGEPALGMCTRRTGGATYVPDLARSRSVLKVAHQVGLIVRGRLSVHADGSVLAGLAIGFQ